MVVNAEIVDDPALFAASNEVNAVPGGNGAVKSLSMVQDTTLVSDMSFERYVADMSSDLAQHIHQARSDASASASSLGHLRNLQSSVSGVSMEEEMIAMTQAKNAFEAASKLVQVGDELMNTILSLA